MNAFISTPFGDFDYVKTDFARGSSCTQCCLLEQGVCHVCDCYAFDTDRAAYHFQHHYEIGGAS